MSVNKHNIVYSSCVITGTTVESLGFQAALRESYFFSFVLLIQKDAVNF